MNGEIKLRKYHPGDYNQVVRIFQEGIREVHGHAHRSFYNGHFPQLIVCELLAFFGGGILGLYSLDGGHIEGFTFGIISFVTFCCLSLWIRRTWTRKYIR